MWGEFFLCHPERQWRISPRLPFTSK